MTKELFIYKEYYKTLFNKHNFNKEEKGWKIPDRQPDLESRVEENITSTKSDQLVLSPLDSVFIEDDLKDDIVIRTAIPDLIEGKEPSYNGVILYGPPGTGKTIFLRAIGEVYRKCGAYSKEVSVSSVNSSFVGQFAANLESELAKAIVEAQQRRKQSFLYFDEASILAQDASEGATSVSKHYQEAADVLKRYIGNYRNLVVAISTNLLSESFEDALTREGRLTSFFIGYPNTEQRKRMWKYFTNQYQVLSITDSQAYKLAQETPAEQGAFIEEFSRNYKRTRRITILKQKGYNSLIDALKDRANITEDEVTKSITFDNLYADLQSTLKAKYDRLKEEKQENGQKAIGFNS